MEVIEKIQYHATFAITGTWRGTSRNKLYDALGWESHSDRRRSPKFLQFFKIRNSMTPSYLFDSLLRQRRLLYGNTNPNYYYEIYSRTTRYVNSIFPESVKKLNAIDEFKNCTSLDIFKRNIMSLMRPVCKSVFCINDSIGISYLFQLRVGLSPLKHH